MKAHVSRMEIDLGEEVDDRPGFFDS